MQAGGAFAAALVLRLLLVTAAALMVAAAPTQRWWKPQRFNRDGSLLRFQYQLEDQGSITYVPSVQVYAIDFDTALTAIPALKKRTPAAKVVCYFSAGSWENYRVDNDRARRGIQPADWGASIGKTMGGWPDEKWVDVRSAAVRRIMTKRLQYCKRIGCDGVDPDNVNGYGADTGFPLTQRDLIAFNTFLANTSHSLGLAIGLKNGQDMLPQLHMHYDWAINEECNVYDECDGYKVLEPSKPVLGIEYCDAQENLGGTTLDPACFCPRMNKAGYSFIFKHVSLDASGISCTQYCKRHPAACAQGGRRVGSCQAAQDNMCALLPATPLL